MNRTHTHRPLRRALPIAAALLALLPAMAQNGFNLPFSQFGIGSSEQPFNLPMTSRLGGVAYTRAGNNYVNPFNPASYAAVEPESFVFDMGVNLQMITLRDAGGSLRDADGNVGYLLMAMPVTRWWKVGAGLMPFSTMDYHTEQTAAGGPAGPATTTHSGSGSVSEVFLGSAFNLLDASGKRPSLQVGFNLNFLTGNFQRNTLYSFPGDTTYSLGKRRYKQTTVRNLTLDLGLQLRQPLGERFTLGLGLVFKPHLNLKVDDEALIYTYHSGYEEYPIDTIFPARGGSSSFKSRLEQPRTLGLGLSLERNRQWLVAFDATFAEYSTLRYIEGQPLPLFSDGTFNYGPSNRYALGLEKLGNMDTASYWGRMSWSLGAHIERGSLRVVTGGNEHRLDQWGLGAGVSMPMRRGRSLLSLSVAYSRLGRPDILQREVLTFGIAVSSCERWFFKRKYN